MAADIFFNTFPEYIKYRIEERYGQSLQYPKDCENLSKDIYKQCGESISASTLKRMFGFIEGSVIPRLYTLDVLAKFCGYRNWQHISTPGNQSESNDDNLHILFSEELELNALVNIRFLENSELVLRYKGKNNFLCINSTKDKFRAGDLLNIVVFEKSYPVICESKIREGKHLGAYISEKDDPIKWFSIFKTDYSSGLEHMNDNGLLLIKINSDQFITWGNPSVCKLLGIQEETLTGKALQTILTVESVKNLQFKFSCLDNCELFSDIHFVLKTSHHTHIHVIATMAPIYENEILQGYQMYMKTIDDIEKQENATGMKTAGITTNRNSTYSGCMILDPDWNYLYVNKEIAEQGLYPAEYLLGKKMTDVYPEVQNTRLFFLYSLSMRKKIRIECVEKYMFSNGLERWFALIIEPINDGLIVLSKVLNNEPKQSSI